MRRFWLLPLLLSVAVVAYAATPSYPGITLTGYIRVPMRVVTAAGTITVSATSDYFICVKKTTGAATTVNLPVSPPAGATFLIKDCRGDAATNPITAAAASIDGTGTYVIGTDRASAAFTYDGSGYQVN